MRLAAAALALLLAAPAAAQEDPLRHFIPPAFATTPGMFIPGHLMSGRPDVWPGAPDFLCRQTTRGPGPEHPLQDGTPKCYARSMILGDIGDAPDLVLRRAGPDNASPWAEPAPVAPGTAIGGLYWQAWGGRCDGTQGYWAGCGANGRNAQIFARAEGEQTGASRAGSLHLATTPHGNPGEPIERLVILPDGRVAVFVPEVGRLRVIRAGAPDSCGTGYRCLRIEN